MAPTESSTTHPTRIVVLGGGVAGAEAALTLAIGMPDAEVTIVGRRPTIRLLPDLVYVPFGIGPSQLDIPFAALGPYGVAGRVAEVTSVDTARRCLVTSSGDIEFDVLVAAPGAVPRALAGNGFRSLEDAHRIRRRLEELVVQARAGAKRRIVVRATARDGWTAPACELSLLLATWLRAQFLDDRITTTLATEQHDAFSWFGPLGEVVVETQLRRAGVAVTTSVGERGTTSPQGHLEIEFGALTPRLVDGLPGLGRSGWYEPNSAFEVGDRIFVIGDAVNLPYRAGFAAGWHARQVLRAIGGDAERLLLPLEGIPMDAAEYQMDVGDGVLRARVASASTLADSWDEHDAEISVERGGHPDKLAGLLLHDRVLRHHVHGRNAALAYRDEVARLAGPLPAGSANTAAAR